MRSKCGNLCGRLGAATTPRLTAARRLRGRLAQAVGHRNGRPKDAEELRQSDRLRVVCVNHLEDGLKRFA